MNLNDLLKQPIASGIFYLSDDTDLAKLQARFEALKWRVFMVDGTEVQNKEQCFNRFAADLSFPDHFGRYLRNWEAFEEGFQDLYIDNEADGISVVVLCTNFQAFAENKHDFEILNKIFEDTVEFHLEVEFQPKQIHTSLLICLHKTKAVSGTYPFLDVNE